MYFLISIIFLIASLTYVANDFKRFVIMCIISIGFGVAGSIGTIAGALNNIVKGKYRIKRQDFIDGSCEIQIKKDMNYEERKN